MVKIRLRRQIARRFLGESRMGNRISTRQPRMGLTLLALSLLGLAACSPGQSSTTQGGVVHVVGTWGGNEEDSFKAMVKPFTDRTGIKVSYEGSRDLNALLTTRVQAGNPPELAGLPGPGQMA